MGTYIDAPDEKSEETGAVTGAIYIYAQIRLVASRQ